jgi:site-specific DNA-adenine methylase
MPPIALPKLLSPVVLNLFSCKLTYHEKPRPVAMEHQRPPKDAYKEVGDDEVKELCRLIDAIDFDGPHFLQSMKHSGCLKLCDPTYLGLTLHPQYPGYSTQRA